MQQIIAVYKTVSTCSLYSPLLGPSSIVLHSGQRIDGNAVILTLKGVFPVSILRTWVAVDVIKHNRKIT